MLFTATARLDPTCGERWQSFIAWSGLTHLREAVTLDAMLCPSFFDALEPEDWDHNVQEDFRTDLFRDAAHVVRRAAGARVNVLALVEDPSADDVRSFTDPAFDFCGFDIVDLRPWVSLLLNCGGFEGIFDAGELSAASGLIQNLDRAREIREALRTRHAANPHAVRCEVWAIWRRR